MSKILKQILNSLNVRYIEYPVEEINIYVKKCTPTKKIELPQPNTNVARSPFSFINIHLILILNLKR